MDKLIVENVRCFHSHHEAELAPITILVGENSSGKSTFLSLIRIAWDLGRKAPDFNEEPFLLGAYDQIANYRSGRGGRAKQFRVGYSVNTPLLRQGPRVSVTANFVERAAQPTQVMTSFEADAFSIRFNHLQNTIELDNGSEAASAPLQPLAVPDISSFPRILALISGNEAIFKGLGAALSTPLDLSSLGESLKLLSVLRQEGTRPYAIAPIRTRPQRTYDPVKDVQSPEGGHIPMVFARLESEDEEAWTLLQKSLEAFGDASGLFSGVDIKRIGRKLSDPFQLQVRVSGPAFNLADVGYGVSQILPIMVDSLRSDPGATLLLQQPEIHLHPKAQAELATFLCTLAREQKKRFVIETHSDYLVDRIRADIRKKQILEPNDISILYFERKELGDVTIHRLHLDNDGNIIDAPQGYRRFFLQEEQRLLF